MSGRINVLVVSSKYEPEYAGSAIRARSTYRRLFEKFPLDYEVLASSVTHNHCAVYQVDKHKVTRIAKKPFPLATDVAAKEKRPTAAEKLKHGCNYLVELVLTWKYLIFNAGRFDVIHVFGKNWVTAAVVTFAKMAHKPLITELCNEVDTPYHYEPPIFRLIFGERFPKDTVIVCISKALENMCRRYGYADNIWLRPNPVDTAKFFIDPENKAAFRRRYTKFGPDDVVLLCISKFRPSKNQIFLVEVMKNLPGRFKLLLAGPIVEKGPLCKRDRAYLESIQTSIRQSGLGPRVEVQVKFIDSVDEYMKMSDVFLFPTTTEALGTPMLEAFCCGIPVVANRIPDVTDYWIENGKNGFISDLDAGEFAKRAEMAARIDKAVLRQKREEIASLCSAEVIDRKYFDLIKKLARSEGSASTGKK